MGLAGLSPQYVSTGHLVYVDAEEGALSAVPFDAATLTVAGAPVGLIENIMIKPGGADFSIADTGSGRLAYVTGGAAPNRPLVWLDRNGGEEPVARLAPGEYNSVALSPDGLRLAVDVGRSTLTDVSIFDLARGTLDPLTTDSDRGPRRRCGLPTGVRWCSG